MKSRVVWVPNAIKYNKPESPNVVRSWSAEWELIPECDLKREAYEHLKASVHALGEPFGKAFDEAIAKPSPKPSGKPLAKAMANQEQEQEQEHSEAKASDAGASLASPMSAKEQVWTLGLALLGERCRPMLGKLVATYSDSVVAEALAAAAREQPVDPKAWVTAACAARGAPKANGRDHRGQRTTEDLLDCDPRPPWLEGTGFDDVWQAESAGCGPGNARQFSNGQRAQA